MTPLVCANWCGTVLSESERVRVMQREHRSIYTTGNGRLDFCAWGCADAGRPVNPAPVEPVKDDGPIDGLKWVEWPSNESTYKTHGLDVREDEGATDADE